MRRYDFSKKSAAFARGRVAPDIEALEARAELSLDLAHRPTGGGLAKRQGGGWACRAPRSDKHTHTHTPTTDLAVVRGRASRLHRPALFAADVVEPVSTPNRCEDCGRILVRVSSCSGSSRSLDSRARYPPRAFSFSIHGQKAISDNPLANDDGRGRALDQVWLFSPESEKRERPLHRSDRCTHTNERQHTESPHLFFSKGNFTPPTFQRASPRYFLSVQRQERCG